MHGSKNDSVLGMLKFVSKYEENKVYGKSIPDVMLSKEVMETKVYKTYLAFATGNVIPKKARKRTTSHIKESSLIADDNIIPDDPDVTEQSTRRRRQTGVTIRDRPTETKKKTLEQSLKLKGMEIISDVAMLEADTRKAIKASLHDFRSQHQAGGSSEGAGSKPEVPDESKGKTKNTNKGVGSKPKVLDVSKAKSSDQEISEEEPQGDEFVHTPDDYVPTDDETQDATNISQMDKNKAKRTKPSTGMERA
uniref:Uncharacterized protein n=1 Tax=Tanacetum cinerariifolium TaxID=118510 RepID=A0A699JAP4_TANCI|nr:hypothetical protein [Tanacetum cinerariifolium]GFA22726.1 hypothetical protein [Tanacetum cinerariifolium]